ncbi:MAG: hypothetical protein LBK99_23820 [Opitutaceae bacterium]|jgi:hypothetical protein|nr:hypothetical protein [Opitutaceae bacterium]
MSTITRLEDCPHWKRATTKEQETARWRLAYCLEMEEYMHGTRTATLEWWAEAHADEHGFSKDNLKHVYYDLWRKKAHFGASLCALIPHNGSRKPQARSLEFYGLSYYQIKAFFRTRPGGVKMWAKERGFAPAVVSSATRRKLITSKAQEVLDALRREIPGRARELAADCKREKKVLAGMLTDVEQQERRVKQLQLRVELLSGK